MLHLFVFLPAATTNTVEGTIPTFLLFDLSVQVDINKLSRELFESHVVFAMIMINLDHDCSYSVDLMDYKYMWDGSP